MSSSSEIAKLYKGVIEEVIRNVRNDFVNMGVDEQVLYDLQYSWEQKLLDYKVITPSDYYGGNGLGGMSAAGGEGGNLPYMPSSGRPGPAQTQIGGVPQHFSYTGLPVDPYNFPGNPGASTTYFHPSQGYFEAGGPAAANLPSVGYPMNQQQQQQHPHPHSQQQQQQPGTYDQQQQYARYTNRPGPGQPRPPYGKGQYDGAGDEYTEQIDDFFSVDEKHAPNNPADDLIHDMYREKREKLEAVKASLASGKTTSTSTTATSNTNVPTATEEEPKNNETSKANTTAEEDLINSDLDDDEDENDGDDAAENDGDDGSLDENVVLCQYEKVNRTRNKWRCNFKSGLIHVNGADYVFNKANGEFEW